MHAYLLILRERLKNGLRVYRLPGHVDSGLGFLLFGRLNVGLFVVEAWLRFHRAS